MSENDRDQRRTWRCVFCRMQTRVQLFRVPLCGICLDQVQDFIWVSAVWAVLVSLGFMTGLQFVVEEVLLFGVLVLVKHHLPSIFDRFTETH